MKLQSRAARPSVYLLAALVVGLSLACSGRALAVVITPNASLLRYSFPGNGEFLITIPARNQGVHVMATCETVGARGVAEATVMRAEPSPFFLVWTGQNSPGVGGGANTSGSTSVDETLIADVSLQGDVELEVQNASTMALSNESGGARAGFVTLMW